jgi:tRNA uridine 5-carboxymethylaminomethyl modification enzyme
MFTSRAEYRLHLRADNADQRLTTKGAAVGCVGPERTAAYREKAAALDQAKGLLDRLSASPTALKGFGIQVNQDGVKRSARDLLAYPGMSLARLKTVWPELASIPAGIAEQLEIEAAYRGYMERQEADIRAFRRDESLELPRELDYQAIPGLSNEVRAKLAEARPATLGAAARISGVTPAALTLLLGYVRRRPERLSA